MAQLAWVCLEGKIPMWKGQRGNVQVWFFESLTGEGRLVSRPAGGRS